IDHRALEDPFAAADKAALAAGGAQGLQVSAAGRAGCRAGSFQGGPAVDRAVAVDALDLDGGADLAVELGVAVTVLNEMAVDTVHALFQVDVELVDRDMVLVSGQGIHRHAELLVADILEDVAGAVQKVAMTVFLEDGPKGPAVAVV